MRRPGSRFAGWPEMVNIVRRAGFARRIASLVLAAPLIFVSCQGAVPANPVNSDLVTLKAALAVEANFVRAYGNAYDKVDQEQLKGIESELALAVDARSLTYLAGHPGSFSTAGDQIKGTKVLVAHQSSYPLSFLAQEDHAAGSVAGHVYVYRVFTKVKASDPWLAVQESTSDTLLPLTVNRDGFVTPAPNQPSNVQAAQSAVTTVLNVGNVAADFAPSDPIVATGEDSRTTVAKAKADGDIMTLVWGVPTPGLVGPSYGTFAFIATNGRTLVLAPVVRRIVFERADQNGQLTCFNLADHQVEDQVDMGSYRLIESAFVMTYAIVMSLGSPRYSMVGYSGNLSSLKATKC